MHHVDVYHTADNSLNYKSDDKVELYQDTSHLLIFAMSYQYHIIILTASVMIIALPISLTVAALLCNITIS